MKKSVGILLVCFCLLCRAGVAKAGFVTGTNDEGVFYFPQIMADWCQLDYKDNIDNQTISDCLSVIASKMKDPDETKAAEAKKDVLDLKKEAWVNAFLLSLEIKQKYASLKIQEKAESITENAGDDARTQTSGNGEIKRFISGQYEDLKRLKKAMIDMDAYDVLETHYQIFIKDDEVAE